MMKTRTLLAVALSASLAAPALAGQGRRRTYAEQARDFVQTSIRAVDREIDKMVAALRAQAVSARDGTANSMRDLRESGREAMASIESQVSGLGQGAFQKTHDTMQTFTRGIIPVREGAAAEEKATTTVAKEIASPVTDPLFLRRNDIVLAWKTSMGGRPVRRSMVLEDRVLFEDARGEIYSFHAGNGIAQWLYPLPKPSQFAYRVDEDHLFVVASDVLFELDRRVGLPRRRTTLPFPASSRPTVGEDLFVIASWNRRVYGMERDKRITLWTYMPLHSVESAPALDPRLVFVAETSGKLAAYSPADRRALWDYEADDAVRVDLVTTANHIIFPAEDLFVHCVNRFGGFRAWKFPVRGYVRQPVWTTDERCYFAAEGDAFYAIDQFKGSLLWRVPGGGWPVAVGRQNIYIEGADREIWAIDKKTGEKVWAVSAKPFVYMARNTESDHFYLASEDGDIYAFYLRGDHQEVEKPKPPTPEPEVPEVERPAEPEPEVPGVGTEEPTVPPAPEEKEEPEEPAREWEDEW
ncbi:MAG: PQQ-binding-like beta-propeller repeat protein [Planctomycetota bacterium]